MTSNDEPIVHKPPVPGFPSAVEYPIGCMVPNDVLAGLTDWVRGFSETDVDSARELLLRRFNDVSSSDLSPLCDLFSSYQPLSIVVREDSMCWLRLATGHTIPHGTASLYLGDPAEHESVAKALKEHGIRDNHIFTEFLARFSSLAEHYAYGAFISLRYPWQTINHDWQERIIENYDEWNRSLIFYYSSAGDMLLLHPDDKVGWWLHEESRVESSHASFSEFVSYYVDYLRASPAGLNAYGPPERPGGGFSGILS